MRRAVVVVLPLAAAVAACGAATPDRAAPPRLPAGVDAGHVRYAAATARSATRVSALERATGRTLRSATLRGPWILPAVAGTDHAGSLSGDGRTLALAGPSGEGTSRFALVDTALAGRPRTFTLRGRFAFDALSPDGATVFLVQHVGHGRYWVRAYDVASGKLRPGAIVEKGEANEPMSGAPLARAIAPGGTPVYTLYRRGARGAFVHALNTADAIAECVDLPAGGAWRLAWSRDRTRLFAVDQSAPRRIEVGAT